MSIQTAQSTDFDIETVPALQDEQALQKLQAMGLSQATIGYFYFQVGSVIKDRPTSKRLFVPQWNMDGNVEKYVSYPLFEKTQCRACHQEVTLEDMSSAQYRAQEDGPFLGLDEQQIKEQSQRCPHCRAAKKQARVSWLLSQLPFQETYYTELGQAVLTQQQVQKVGQTWLYNQYCSLDAWQKDPELPLLLVDDIKQVWAAYEAGFPVCLIGHNTELIAPFVEQRLQEHGNLTIIAVDNTASMVDGICQEINGTSTDPTPLRYTTEQYKQMIAIDRTPLNSFWKRSRLFHLCDFFYSQGSGHIIDKVDFRIGKDYTFNLPKDGALAVNRSLTAGDEQTQQQWQEVYQLRYKQ